MAKCIKLSNTTKWSIIERYLSGVPVGELCKQPGVSRPNIQRWLDRVRKRVDLIFEHQSRQNSVPPALRSPEQPGAVADQEQAWVEQLSGEPAIQHDHQSDELLAATNEAFREQIARLQQHNTFLQDCVDGHTKAHIENFQREIARLTQKVATLDKRNERLSRNRRREQNSRGNS